MAVTYCCQRRVYRLADRTRFDQERTAEAKTHPDVALSDLDEAVNWLGLTVGGTVGTLSKTQLVRSGFDDPERFERMDDAWRESLGRGDMAGSIVPAGDGYVAHIHCLPVERA